MWVLMLIGVIASSDVPPQKILSFDTYDECLEAEMQDHVYDNVVYVIQYRCQKFQCVYDGPEIGSTGLLRVNEITGRR